MVLIILKATFPKWQANRKKPILPLEKYFKTLKDKIIVTAST